VALGATAANVNALNGATFTQSQVDVAAGLLEGYLGWHVAPIVEDATIRVYSSGGPTIVLPTLRVSGVASVTEVRDSTVMTDYYLAGHVNDLQVLERNCGAWPRGWYDVELTHGYDAPPKDLLKAVEAVCQLAAVDPAVAAESIDDYMVRYRSELPDAVSTVSGAIARYGLPAVA
jgi:hypothetical protein